MGRKCFFDKGFYKLYPNLFTILVAGSGRCRKSTAINLAVDLLNKVPSTRIVSGKITPEKFLHELAPTGEATPPNILIHSSELSVFMTKQQYGEPLIYLLTDLYDCPTEWTYKTKNKGDTVLRDVFMCILAATTPDGIAHGVPPSVLKEGFASRVLFVYQPDTDRRNALPTLSLEEQELREHLRTQLTHMGEMRGEFILDADARDWYIDWYDNMKPPADSRLEGMWARRHDHVLRVAMVLAAQRYTQVIDPNDLQAATMAIEALEALAPQALQEVGGDQHTQFLTRVKVYLAIHKRVTHSELLRVAYPCRADMFKNLLDTLIQSGVAAIDPEKSNIYLWVDVPKTRES